ncbi:MAG: hypothetical protein COC24_004340 [Alphaproteobacteria bacterium]|nr:hypothetical protein [Alphaproteobacteria bacterium]
MIKIFKQEWPILSGFVLAASVAMLVWICASYIFDNAEHNLWLRVCYAAAAILIFTDVIETAYIAWEKSTYKNLDFWMFAFYVGYVFAILMILMFWRGADDIIQVIIPQMVSGAFFGIAMAFISRREQNQVIWQKYDLENPLNKTIGVRRFIYCVWPMVVVGFAWHYIDEVSTKALKPNFMFFQIIFMAGIVQIYQHKSYASVGLWRHLKLVFPKLSGIAVLIFGLYML